MANQSFQEHLNSLDAETKLRKIKVMDWIQKSSNEAWDRENRTKSGRDPARLKLDPGSNLPTQRYQKQEPIYASADDVDESTNVVPSADSGRNRSSGSLPNQSWVPEWRPGSADQRYRMEPRPRVATVSGTRMEPVPQRQYPPTSRQNNMGVQGRAGGEVQGPAGQPNLPANYPTARFGKDYYVLDV